MAKIVGQIRSAPGGGFADVILDGSGNGTAKIGPIRVREHWQPVSVSVAVASTNKEASAKAYLGSHVGADTFVSATASGSHGDTCGLGSQDIQPGMFVWVVWSGGDVGAKATMTVYGTYSLGH